MLSETRLDSDSPDAAGGAEVPHELSPHRRGPTGLILSGGGARAAYQVGVLKALARLQEQWATESGYPQLARRNPFRILAGTSAGAINAAAFAAGADDFQEAVARIVHVWENFRAEQVYRADSLGVVKTGARWLTALSIGWSLRKWSRTRPRALFDTTPLAALLDHMIDTGRIQRLLESGALDALAVSVSSYTTGQNVTFYQSARPIQPWTRSQRLAVSEPITAEHLLASSAIPFLFPARRLTLEGQEEYCGDGSMRQIAPISPAIHLGADRVLVIGVGRLQEPPGEHAQVPLAYPSLAQIAGHALSSIFLDGMAADIERLMRINRTLALLPSPQREQSVLRPIEVLVISPSKRLDEIAAAHIGSLPLPVRALMRGVGATEKSGAALASYLLFESSYTRELMELGMNDTFDRKGEVLDFLVRTPVTTGATAPA